MLRDLRLNEEGGFFWINSGRKNLSDRNKRPTVKGFRVVLAGDRMEVYDTKKRIMRLLQFHPLLQSTEIVPQMK